MNVPAPPEQQPAIARFTRAAGELAARIAAAEPDVAVVFAPDHFRGFFYDNMPAFCVGVGELDGWGDWATPRGPFTVAHDLARHVARSLFDDGFEPAVSYRLRADHGLTQPLALLGLAPLPVVPIVMNAAAPPLPTPQRCHAFGAAIGAALSAAPGNERIAVIASGGLSHAPPAVSVESRRPEDAPVIERLISGRASVEANAAEREARLIATVERYADRINPAWDRRVLDRFAAGEAAALAAELREPAIEAEAGNGGQEIRTWLAAAAAAADTPLETLAYEPIRFFITGMGVAVSGRLA